MPVRVPTTIAGQLWALPICLSIAIVYKTLKLKTFDKKTVVRETGFLFLTIIGFLLLAAVILTIIAHIAGQL